MFAELRRALRTLRREPGFVAAAVVTLSLGIGANAAMFGVVDALVFSPPPGVGESAGLVRVNTVPDPTSGEHTFFLSGFTRGDLAAFTEPQAPFAELAAYTDREVTVGDEVNVRKTPALLVSGGYFRVLRAPVALGRPLIPSDDAAGATPVAVVSDAFWRRTLGGERAAIGRTIHVGGHPVVVAGVARPGFVGMDLAAPDLWMPIAASGVVGDPITEANRQLSIVGRLRPGVTRAGATAAAGAILRARDAVAPGRMRMPGRRLVALGDAAHRISASRGANPVPVWLLGATLAVLLVACANVASLTLARAERRRHDAAVRVSLGAGPWRLARQALAESALLALAGALGGTLVAAWSSRIVDALSLPPLPPLVGPRVVAVTALLALAAMVLAGIGPAVTSAKADPASTLGGGAGRVSRRRSRAQFALTAGQIAMTLTLLVTAGLFVRSLRNARLADVGYDLEHTLVVSVDLTPARFDGPATDALLRVAARRLKAMPGVRSVSLAAFAPFNGLLITQPSVPGAPPPADPMTPGNMVDAEFFNSVGAAMRGGRSFVASEVDAHVPVVVLNESAARAFFPAGDALDRCITINGECDRVVGIVRNMRSTSLTTDDGPFVYLPFTSSVAAHGTAELYVRTTDDPALLAAAARSAVQSTDAALPYVSAQPAVDFIRPQLAAWQVAAVAFSVFGVAALVLASVGLYAVIAYQVAQRTREVGIRMALGAVRRDVVRLVVGQGARVAGLGIAVGLAGAFVVGNAVRAKLYGVGRADPATFLAVAALLAFATLVASWLPARRAARVDPAVALRAE